MLRPAVIAAAAGLVLAACSGGGGPTPSTTSTTVPTTAAPTFESIEVTGEVIVQRKPGDAVFCQPADSAVVVGSAIEVRDQNSNSLGHSTLADGDEALVTGEDVNGDQVDDRCHLPFTIPDVSLSGSSYALWVAGQESEPITEDALRGELNFTIGKPTAVPSPKPPAGTFPGDGTFLVPSEVKPGTYRSTAGDGCYWARLGGTSGDLADIIANGNPSGPAVVTIRAGDKAFETARCGEWRRI